jgi:CheY-like chemotaxis protein
VTEPFASQARVRTSTAVILVVDDEIAVTGVISAVLGKSGYTVHCAHDGGEGVQMASSCKPDLIIMDITMPSMSGYEATEKIKANPELKNVPVIFLSGKSAAEDGGEAFRKGGATYLQKPFNSNQLRDLVALTLLTAR